MLSKPDDGENAMQWCGTYIQICPRCRFCNVETVSVPAWGGLLIHSDEEILRSGERDQGVSGVVHLGYL